MPAGYIGAWITSFEEALNHVEGAGWHGNDALCGLLTALSDGAVASRWVDNQERIDPAAWVKPVFVEGVGPILRDGKTYPYREIEFCRADLERIWPRAAALPVHHSELQPSSPREQRRKETRERYETWFKLALENGYTDRGKKRNRDQIAKAVAEILRGRETGKWPSPATIRRGLNQDHPGWAEESWANRLGKNSSPT